MSEAQENIDEQRRVHGGLNDMIYSNCPFCGDKLRHRKADCLANLKHQAAQVPKLQSEIAALKDELNRLALVRRAGVGIYSCGYKRRQDVENHDGRTL